MREVLLRSVGETVAGYGGKLFALTADTFKAMAADQIIVYVDRVVGGLFQKAQSVGDCLFTLKQAILRQYLPSSGRVFLENRSIGNDAELRDGLEDWLSTRAKGNYFKPVGNESSVKQERSSSGYGKESSGAGIKVTCYVCGKPGHRAFECRFRDSGNNRNGSGNNETGQGRVLTCYN